MYSLQPRCNSCSKRYGTKGRLQRHIKAVHLQVKDFHCELCDYKASQKSQLDSHMLSKHSEDEGKFKCEECGATFKQKGNLTKHQRIHKEDALYKCKYCPASFKQVQHLNYHVHTHHTKEKPITGLPTIDQSLFHECKYCNHVYTELAQLQKHNLKCVDRSTLPHACNSCSKRYGTKGGLQRHIKAVHLQIKDFHCEHLNYHIYALHTKEK